MPLPDYEGNSIVNLMSSLGQALACQLNDYPTATNLPVDEIRDSRNLVLLVIDGLGYEYLCNYGSGSILHHHLRSSMTSVFPSTTATAITTFMTGLAPQQHGLTGWHTYLKELGCVTAVLPFRPRVASSGFNSNTIDVHKLYGHTPLFDLINRPSYVVAPEWIIHSEYNVAHSGSALLHGYNSLAQCFQNIEYVVKSSQRRKYIYAYWPDFDRYSHESGCSNVKVNKHFVELDNAFGKLLKDLDGTDTTIIVTADHGFIDTETDKIIHLSDHPVMQDSLVLPLCGEPRAAYCYVHPHKQQQFTDYVDHELSDFVELKSSESLVTGGYFGSGKMHTGLYDRIGHYALIMRENYVLKDRLAGEPPFIHIGVHGGISSQEMFVPLIVAHC